MTYFISGGAKNGKSTLAQDLAVALAGGGKHYYVATMISTGSEDDARIRRHVADHTASVDQIEAWTGFDFFVNLPDPVETASESNTSWTAFENF